MQKKLIDAFSLLMVLSVPSVFCQTNHTTRNLRPNVIIFIADDLGIGDVGCFGNDTIRTPHIDRIARRGATLTHNLAAEAICTPSRAALMTGRYPIRSGMTTSAPLRVISHTSDASGLPASELTIAEAAKLVGYNTALIGKWHLGVHGGLLNLYAHHPLGQGFDYYYGTPLSNIRDFDTGKKPIISKAFPGMTLKFFSVAVGALILIIVLRRLQLIGLVLSIILFLVFVCFPMHVYFSYTNLKFFNSMIMRNYDVVEQPLNLKLATFNLVGEGIKYLEERKNHQEPFLLVMSWIQVHTALHASERFRRTSKHGKYGAEVEEMDWSVGEIMNALERLGYLDNNTLVYFTSDNGGHLEENVDGEQEGGWNGIYRGGKGQGGMDGGIRVPTVAMWKNHIEPNTVIDVPTSHMDILPTLMSVWGQELPTDRVIDGRNIYPLLTGRDTTPPHRFLMHYCGTEIHSARYTPDDGGDVYKVYYRTPKWIPGTHTCQFICFCTDDQTVRHDPPLLYNIGRDPSEKNLLDSTHPSHQQIIEMINEAVAGHKMSVQPVPSQMDRLKQIPMPWLQHCCNFPYCSCTDPVVNSR